MEYFSRHSASCPSQKEMESFSVERNLKNLQIEDLLGRQTIEVDVAPIESMVKGKVVMITGAAGSIGSEIVRQLSIFPRHVTE